MNEQIEQILKKISYLEKKLQDELRKEDKLFDFTFEGKKVCFNKELLKEQQKHLEDIFTYLKNAPILYIITSPIIYGLIIPALILDITVTIYQAINFRVYNSL